VLSVRGSAVNDVMGFGLAIAVVSSAGLLAVLSNAASPHDQWARRAPHFPLG
jgi:hypothetical protein